MFLLPILLIKWKVFLIQKIKQIKNLLQPLLMSTQIFLSKKMMSTLRKVMNIANQQHKLPKLIHLIQQPIMQSQQITQLLVNHRLLRLQVTAQHRQIKLTPFYQIHLKIQTKMMTLMKLRQDQTMLISGKIPTLKLITLINRIIIMMATIMMRTIMMMKRMIKKMKMETTISKMIQVNKMKTRKIKIDSNLLLF